MKKLILLQIILAACSAHARIGETRDECDARYGNSVGSQGTLIVYSKDHMHIAVSFDKNNRSIRELFSPEPFEQFTKEQIDDLLNANSEGSAWYVTEELPGKWRKYGRKDQCAVATLTGSQSPVLDIRRWQGEVPKKPSDSGF